MALALPRVRDVQQGDRLAEYLHKSAQLKMMSEVVKLRQEQMKPLIEEVKKILQDQDLKRFEFQLDEGFAENEKKYLGPCHGLRLAPKTRHEPLSAKDLKRKL